MNIIVTYVHPPIPLRKFDYSAHIDGREEDSTLYGWGETREEALASLGGQILEHVADHIFDMYVADEISSEVNEAIESDFCSLEYCPW